MALRVLTPDDIAHQHLCRYFKAAVKADVPKLRQLATSMKVAQRKGDNSLVSEHLTAKTEARARLLVYGFVRGKDWGITESNHPEGVKRIQRWFLKSEWLAAVKACETCSHGSPVPPLVTKWVPLG